MYLCKLDGFLDPRFYFRNWHGLNEKEPSVCRYTLKAETDMSGTPLLEFTSLEYLFAQVTAEHVSTPNGHFSRAGSGTESNLPVSCLQTRLNMSSLTK